jgi:ferric-dicitrate binding protein FerR (iron transport regulator)
MDDSKFELQELVTNERFRRWVLSPGAADDQFWQDWLAAHPDRKEMVAKARILVVALQPKEPEVSAREGQAGWDRLSAALASRRPASRRRWLYSYRVAAAVALLVCAIAAGWWLTVRFGRVTYATPYGQTLSLTLPDGSRVVLNANSQLDVPRHWPAGRSRQVWLRGEAYFQVKKDPAKTPFSVHADQLEVQVLGTSFDVLNRRHKNQVVLKEGSVRVKLPAQRDVLMQPGELLELAPAAPQASKRKVNPDHYKAWLDKKIVFKGTPLREVAQTIEDLYGYQVEFQDPALAEKQVTALLPMDNLDGLLLGLGATFGLDIRKAQQKLIIGNDSSQDEHD